MSLLRQFFLRGAAGDLAEVVDPSSAAAAAGWAQKGLRVIVGRTDPVANLPVLVDYNHHQVHRGGAWCWSTYVPVLGTGQHKDVRLIVPPIAIPPGNSAVGLCPHLRFEVVSSGDAQVLLYEHTTFIIPGAFREPIAHERNGLHSPKLQVHEEAAVEALGTLLWQGLLLAASPRAASENEFVLKNSTDYLLRVTSQGAINKVLIALAWHEDLGD